MGITEKKQSGSPAASNSSVRSFPHPVLRLDYRCTAEALLFSPTITNREALSTSQLQNLNTGINSPSSAHNRPKKSERSGTYFPSIIASNTRYRYR